MIGLSNKGGGSNVLTPNTNLAQLFLGNATGGMAGYQQPNVVPTITAPQMPGSLSPSPEQAAAATRARFLARNPMPVAAPAVQPKPVREYSGRNR